MTLRHSLRKLIWTLGYDIIPFRPDIHPLARRRRLLEQYGVDVVLDVGANTGQYALELRNDVGFKGRIVSFEPLQSAFQVLEHHASRDPGWSAMHCALGDEDGTACINVAANSYSSSILDMLPAHVNSAPDSRYTGPETISTRRLDSIFEELCPAPSRCYLKLDVQGFEGRVLAGATRSLARIQSIQLEMSLTPMYAGEVPFGDMHRQLEGMGYALVAIEPGFADAITGQLLQVDGIYHRHAAGRS